MRIDSERQTATERRKREGRGKAEASRGMRGGEEEKKSERRACRERGAKLRTEQIPHALFFYAALWIQNGHHTAHSDTQRERRETERK